jgi:hypothetical protein
MLDALRFVSKCSFCSDLNLSLSMLVLQAQGKVNDVYDTCSAILTELGESIPESYNLTIASKMTNDTLHMYAKAANKGWLERKETGDKTLRTTLQFYSAIALASYFCKSYSMVVYFTCKAVQLSLRKGICEHTSLTLIQFTSVAANDENAVLC